MAQDTETFNNELYNLLKVRGYKPAPLNSQNQRVGASQQADVIEFTFTKDGDDYGKAWVSVDDASNLKIYFDDEQQESPDTTTPGVDYDDTWTGLLKFLKNWAQRRQLSFELSNKDRLGDDMRQRDYYKMKEKLGEGYHSMGKKASYNDVIPEVKIVIQHNRALEEGEQRYRNVARIFLENADGERFLAPTTRPGIARVFARHIAEGGVPNDDRWNHIKSVCEDYNKMAGFVRATRNKEFNESALSLVQEGANHYSNLRETLSKLAGHRGYHAYFESWTPSLMEDEGDDISINELFVQETVDPRIENVMPILSKLRKNVAEMTEVDTLAEWADSIISEKLEEEEKKDDEAIGKGKNVYIVTDASGTKKVTVLADYPQAAKDFAATHWGMSSSVGLIVKDKKPESPKGSDSRPSDGEALNKATATKDKADEPKKSGGAFDQVKQSVKQNWDRANPGPDMLANIGKLGAALAGVTEEDDVNEMEKDLHSGTRHDPRKGPQGPDKTAKMMAAKKAIKDARKALDKAFNGEVDENFINMAPQAVAEEELDEVGDTDAGQKALAKTWLRAGSKAFRAKRAKDEYEHGYTAAQLSKEHEKHHTVARQADERLKPETERFTYVKEEGLDANQKRVGQLGPTEKVKNNNIGKLVGANESTEIPEELARIIEMAKFKR